MTSEHFKGEDLETRVQQLEEELAILRGDSTLRNLPCGTLKETKSIFSLRSIGGSLGGAYPAGVFPLDNAPGTSAFAADYLLAVPFYLPGVPNAVAKIGIRVTGATAGNFRLGIYADKGESMLYPGKLLLDAGAVSTSTTGVKSIVVRRGFPRGLVWVALLGSSATPTIRAFAFGKYAWALLGYNEASTSRYTHYRVSQAYGALPNPYPAGATERPSPLPYIFLKFG